MKASDHYQCLGPVHVATNQPQEIFILLKKVVACVYEYALKCCLRSST